MNKKRNGNYKMLSKWYERSVVAQTYKNKKETDFYENITVKMIVFSPE